MSYLIDNILLQENEKLSNPKDIIGSNKLPLGMVPSTTMCYLTLGHSEGHIKYGLYNWREAGVRYSIYKDALLRHLVKYEAGEEEDPETGVPHLANAITCLSIIIDAKECDKLIDDRPKAVPNLSELIDRFSKKLLKLKQIFGDKRPTDYFITGPKERV